jgi:polyisoprenoid-binding protein YceI
VAKHPTITFKSTEVTDATPAGAKLHGLLSIHGVEQPVTLDLTIHGEGPDPWGNLRSGFTATATVNRKDFGVAWNKVLETGQLLVGEEVEITLEVEGLAKQP